MKLFKNIKIMFHLFDFEMFYGNFYISVLEIEGRTWNASFFYLETGGYWKFDFLWLRPLFLKISNYRENRRISKRQR